MKLKNEKGSITIFVLVGMLFMSAFLIISYAGNVNKSKVVKEQLEIIKSIYQMKVQTVDNIYNKLTIMPIINDLPEVIFIGADRMEDYIESGDGEEIAKIEIIVDDQTFYSEEDMNKYIEENDAFGEKEITITVTNSIGNTTTKNEIVTFKEITNPVIENLPNTIITNVTQVKDYYVSYDDLGKKEENYTVEVFNQTFDSMIKVVQYADRWLEQNKQYEVEVEIKILATGNNNLTSESTQKIKLLRGNQVTTEADLIDALYSTEPSYIKVETSNSNNEIICNSPITLDGVTHKLDLNGNKISYTVTSASEGSTLKFLTLGPNANLTVIDSTEDDQGGIVFNVLEEVNSDGDDRKTKVITVDNQGVLNVESGIIEVNISRKIGNGAKKDGNVHDTGVAIENSGTVNLNGGTISTNVVTQSCSYLTIQISEAIAKGIVNNGTINVTSGTINTNAEAYAVQSSGAVWKGETEAYAYGIENNGTINNSESITFSTTATAHKESSRKQTEEALDIK